MQEMSLKTMRVGARRQASRQSGQALIFAAFGMLAFVACAGLAVDMGYLRYQRRLQQSAADSAALAGASAAGTGGDVQGDAQADAKLNGFEHGQKTFPDAKTTIKVVVDPPKTLNGKPNAVTVTITAEHPNFFMRIFGPALLSTTFDTTATAQYLQASNCMFALPGGNGITIKGNVNVRNCGVVDAEDLGGTGSLTAAAIGVHGTNNLTTTNPAVVSGILQTSDPFANMTAPGGGGAGDLLINDANYPTPKKGPPPPININPANYDSISIVAGFLQNVTFKKGAYHIGTGGISLLGNGLVSGSGVTFFVSGGGVTFGNSQRIQLSAPTNNPNQAILLFQKTSKTDATIDGGAGSFLTGSLYFPQAKVTINGAGSCNNQYMILIAKTININANVNCPSNYNPIGNNSPIKAATLVQ